MGQTHMGQTHTAPAYERQMVALGRILQALRDSQTPQDAMQMALDHVHEEFGFDVSWIGLYDRLHHRLKTQGCHIPNGQRLPRTTLNLTSGDVLEQVVIQQRPLLVADLKSEPRAGEWGAIAAQMGLQSTLIFPIRRQDTCFGILLLASQQWGINPSAGERSHLSVLMGFLAESLYQFEAETQRRQTPNPEKSLFSLLDRLGLQADLDSRLRIVISETQTFIRPQRTRIFWFEPQGGYFWQRMPSRRLRKGESPNDPAAAVFSLEEIRGIYPTLCNGQLVFVGESQGFLNSAIPERMMQQLQTRSLIVAPILFRQELIGLLTVEGDQPRLWREAEKRYLQGVAQLVALALPTADAEAAIQQVQADQVLTSGIVKGIYSDVDWHQTLQESAVRLCERLSAQQFVVLLFDEEQGGYEVCFRRQTHQRSLPCTWPSLDDVDWQMLERSTAAIALDDIEYDLKLMAWRPILQALEVRSVLVCNVSPGNAPEGIVLVTHQTVRHWTESDRDLLEAVAKQVGVILQQWQLQRQVAQQTHLYESVQWGLHTLQRTFQLPELEQSTLHYLTQLLQVPGAVLVTWLPGEEMARVQRALLQDPSLGVDAEVPIPVRSDALINWALQTDGVLPVTIEDLPEATLQWITAPAQSRFLITALRTAPDHVPTGILVAVAPATHRWSDYHQNLFHLLAQQFAWSRRHLSLAEMLVHQRDALEQLNWYKHSLVSEFHRHFKGQIQALKGLETTEKALIPQKVKTSIHQLENLAKGLTPMVQKEQWQLQITYQTIPLIRLLNRLIDRANPLIQERQLWTKVHNESNVIIGGDITKLEFLIYEVLALACLRSQPGERIDIWCRQVDRNQLELSITDSGKLEPQLFEELENGRPKDLIVPSALDIPPGLNLSICKGLLTVMGGNLTLTQLDDGRTYSQILLPTAKKKGMP